MKNIYLVQTHPFTEDDNEFQGGSGQAQGQDKAWVPFKGTMHSFFVESEN